LGTFFAADGRFEERTVEAARRVVVLSFLKGGGTQPLWV